jgi:hypothetical protein
MDAKDDLKRILELTEAMFAAAIQSSWEELDVLQNQQAMLIKAYNFASVSAYEFDILRNVSDLTAQVIDLAENHKKALFDELALLKKNSGAQSAYLQNIE